MRFLPPALVLAVAVLPPRLVAQCPDGTPPPCRGASGAAHRVNPPLDEKTWIIVPFDNVARVADIDWLKDASVNLLYLDMSKWRDIRVIDDERVADFIREVPEVHAGQTLTLQGGIAVARRAGAGKLVMGDVLRVGSRTQLVAKVFDVRSGQRVRTVRQDAPVADSIMPAFGQLARGVLNLAPPEGASVGAIGTTSVGAYQAYIAGVGFLNRFVLDSARLQFTRAIERDSTFALAHYKLSIVAGWESGNSPEAGRQAQLALRLGGTLPPREHNLVAGHAAFSSQRYPEACATFTRMLRLDSTDVEAWYNLGECSYHDNAIVPAATDTTRMVFRGDWNLALRAFRRVLLLDPSYHLAFQHIEDALVASTRTGCRVVSGAPSCTPSTIYSAAVRRAGDTLVVVPVNMQAEGPAYEAQVSDARATHARRRNLEEAERAAAEWLLSPQAEGRARLAHAIILLRQGHVAAADEEVRRLSGPRSPSELGSFIAVRFEASIKLGRVDEVSRLVDSVRSRLDTSLATRFQFAVAGVVFGRITPMDTVIDQAVQGAPPVISRYFKAALRAQAGVPLDSLYEIEQAMGPMLAVAGPRLAPLMVSSLAFADLRARGGRWPFRPDTSSSDPRMALAGRLAGSDTARMRSALAHFDSLMTAGPDEPDNGFAFLSANAHLLLGDSAAALGSLRFFRDTTLTHTPLLEPLSSGFAFNGWLWPRTFLLLGDLAAAQGQRAVAADAYGMFVGMWQHGDAEVQPMVQRAREALARLGN